MPNQGRKLLLSVSDSAFGERHNRNGKTSYVLVVGGRAVKIVEDTYYTLLEMGTQDVPNEFPSIESANYIAYMLRLQTWEVREVGHTIRGNILW